MFLKRRFLTNSSGSAQLIAVLAAAAISSVIMLTNAQMLSTFSKQNRKVLQTNIALDLRKQVEVFLQDKNCAANFGKDMPGSAGEQPGTPGGNLADLPIKTTSLKREGSNEEVFTPGNTFDNGLLRFIGWNLKDTTTVIIPRASNAHSVVDLNLILEGTDGQRVARTIKLFAEKFDGPTSRIKNCYSLSESGEEFWARDSGGTNIYNTNPGNVGMFNNSPTEKLDVIGDVLFAGDVLQKSISNSGNSSIADNLTIHQTTGLGVSPGAHALQVLGDSRVVNNFNSLGTFSTNDLTISTSFNVLGNLNVVSQSTLGPVVSGNSPRLRVDGPVSFDLNTVAPHAVPDTWLHGTASFASTVRTTSSISIGSPLSATSDLSITGTTNITSLLETTQYEAPALCISGNCRTDFSEKTCPQGMKTINVDGSVACANMTCNSDQLFKGLDSSGQAICEDLNPTTTCPRGQYLQSVNPATGDKTCLPLPTYTEVAQCGGDDRQRVYRISDGVASCRPTDIVGGPACSSGENAISFNADGSVTCASPVRGSPRTCTTGDSIVGMNADGTPICGNIYANAVSCSVGTVATGINTDGSLNCVPVTHLVSNSCIGYGVAVGIQDNGALICGCPSMTATWTGSGVSCTALLYARVPGSVTVSDSTSPSTGSATYTCTIAGWTVTPVSSSCVSDPRCGTADHASMVNAPSTLAELCEVGNPSSVADSGNQWTWTCSASSLPSASCSTNKRAVACNGIWSSCSCSTGTQTFTITQSPLNGGAACPTSPQTCDISTCP